MGATLESVAVVKEGEILVMFGGFEIGEIHADARGIAAVGDGVFEEGALVEPSGLAEESLGGEGEEPEGEEGEDGADGERGCGEGEGGGKEEPGAGEIEPMFGDGGVEGEEVTDGEVGENKGGEGEGDEGMVAGTADGPEGEGEGEEDAREGLKFAESGVVKCGGGRVFGGRGDIAFHVEMEWGHGEGGVFGEGAGGEDGADGERGWGGGWRGKFFSGEAKSGIGGEDAGGDGDPAEIDAGWRMAEGEEEEPEEEGKDAGFFGEERGEEGGGGGEGKPAGCGTIFEAEQGEGEGGEAEEGGEGIGATGDIGDGGSVEGMNGPD